MATQTSFAIELVPGFAESLFHTKSPALVLPKFRPGTTEDSAKTVSNTTSKTTPETLGQFTVINLQSGSISPSPSDIDTAPPAASSRQKNSNSGECEFHVDVMCNAGGLVWACDFRTWPPGSMAASTARHYELLAAAVHPADVKRNKAGQSLQGPGAVQIWDMPNTKLAEGSSTSGGVPRLALCIIHNGCVTWAVKWCPDPTRVLTRPMTLPTRDTVDGQPAASPSSPDSPPIKRARGGSKASVSSGPTTADASEEQVVPSVGVLAFISGDALVNIVSVPELSALMRATSNPTVPSVRMANQYQISREMLGGSVPCSLEWQRVDAVVSGTGPATSSSIEPRGIKLLVGCCDGMVSGWRLPPSTLHQLHCMFHIKVDSMPVWTLSWCPNCSAYDSLDNLREHTFMTMAHSGTVKIWDDRDLVLPLQKQLMARNPARCAAWVPAPHCIVSVHEDGCLRQLIMDPISHNCTKEIQLMSLFSVPDQGCLWSLSYSAPLSSVMYCGDDGVAAIMVLRTGVQETRRRLPHAALGGFASQDDALQVLSPLEAAKKQVIYPGPLHVNKAKGRGKANSLIQPAERSFKDQLQTLYTCTFSPNVVEERVWVAYGGHAGLIRFQRIVVDHRPDW